MTIVSNNSYMFNMEMDFWELAEFNAEDLTENWDRIYEFAKDDHTEDAAYFLADCMDVLCEKILALPAKDRNKVIDKASEDMDSYNKRHKLGAA